LLYGVHDPLDNAEQVEGAAASRSMRVEMS
jgi:hypothetical protein